MARRTPGTCPAAPPRGCGESWAALGRLLDPAHPAAPALRGNRTRCGSGCEFIRPPRRCTVRARQPSPAARGLLRAPPRPEPSPSTSANFPSSGKAKRAGCAGPGWAPEQPPVRGACLQFILTEECVTRGGAAAFGCTGEERSERRGAPGKYFHLVPERPLVFPQQRSQRPRGSPGGHRSAQPRDLAEREASGGPPGAPTGVTAGPVPSRPVPSRPAAGCVGRPG